MIHDADIEQVLFSEDELKAIVRRTGTEITADYQGKKPLLVSVLRGAVFFTTDLARAIDLPITMDFMVVSSYKGGVKSTGTIEIVKDLSEDVAGRDIIIAEDILDSGLTLRSLVDLLEQRGAASVEVATLFVKDIEGYTPPITPRYVGAHVPDGFLVGYGLDYAELYRNMPYVGILKPEIYS